MKDIELSFNILDASTFDTITESKAISIKTSADKNYEQKFDESGFVAYEKNGIKIVVKKLESENSFWGSDIYVYLKNETDQDITVQASNVSINGYMVYPMFSSDIVAGKVSYDTMTFLESDLEDNGITNIEDLELQFNILDMKSYDTIADSDIVKVSFTK